MELLSGQIKNYKCEQKTALFVFTESDKVKMGAIAIAAGLSGLAAQSAATLHSSSSLEEEASFVTFELGDKAVQGWLWRSPFVEEDEVEVVAEWQQDHFELYGIRRPKDHIVALYPHCSRGRVSHWRNALKWLSYLIMFIAFITEALMFAIVFFRKDFDSAMHFSIDILPGLFLIVPFFSLMVWFLGRKWMSYVRLAERTFTVFGWANPKIIDLVKSSNAQRTGNEPRGYGTFFFRY